MSSNLTPSQRNCEIYSTLSPSLKGMGYFGVSAATVECGVRS